MTLLYKLAISVYHILIWLSAPFNGKARLYVSGRRNWQVKLNRQVDMNARYIWIHCASLGEFEQGRPLIEAIRNEVPEYKIVLTFFSPSGYEKNILSPISSATCPPITAKMQSVFWILSNRRKSFSSSTNSGIIILRSFSEDPYRFFWLRAFSGKTRYFSPVCHGGNGFEGY